MIHGAASGETVKFVGSSTAHMTSPMRKSYVDAQRRWISPVTAECADGAMRTQTNSFKKTWPKFVPGVTYIAKTPAGPLGVNSVESRVPAAARASSAACQIDTCNDSRETPSA